MSTRTATAAGLSQDQRDLIEQFEADYNAVDRFLRGRLDVTRQSSFTNLVREYAERHRGWGDADLLRTIAEVRNAIVHGKTEPYYYVAMPSPALAEALRGCRQRLLHPSLVYPQFQKTVVTVQIADSLTHVLALLEQHDFSQFPVYDSTRFCGLLTENGITRWLASHITRDASIVDLDDVPIRHVLREEENKKAWAFIPRTTRRDDAVALFSARPLLEAVLITNSGKPTEKLMGIATRWDILQTG